MQVRLDDGGIYTPKKPIQTMLKWWEEFWGEFVPEATKKEPWALIINGDVIEGNPHGSKTSISTLIDDQVNAADELLRPILSMSGCAEYYHVRGTEAHVEKSAEAEERLAKMLGAKPNKHGQHARWRLKKRVGTHEGDFLHHIGTTGSSAHEASAVNAELTALLQESARWGHKAPDFLVRSHRHRAIEIRVPGERGWRFAVVTPSWQLMTPFAYKVPGARISTPQIGGIVIRSHQGICYTIPKIWHVQEDEAE